MEPTMTPPSSPLSRLEKKEPVSIWRHYVIPIVGYAGAYHVGGKVLSRMFSLLSKDYAASPLARKNRIISYALSFVNAVLCSGASIHSLLFGRNWTNMSELKAMFGYFVQDFIRTRAEWHLYPADFIHHCFAFGIMSAVFKVVHNMPGAKLFIPPFLGLEFSTVFLDVMWLLREFGLNKTKMHTTVMAMFGASFVALRVAFLPYYVYQIRTQNTHLWNGLGRVGKSCIYAACVLQYYWFLLLIKKFIK